MGWQIPRRPRPEHSLSDHARSKLTAGLKGAIAAKRRGPVVPMRYLFALPLLIASGIPAEAQNGIMHQSLGGTYDYGAGLNLDSPRVHSSTSRKARSENAGVSSARTRHDRSRDSYDPNKSMKK